MGQIDWLGFVLHKSSSLSEQIAKWYPPKHINLMSLLRFHSSVDRSGKAYPTGDSDALGLELLKLRHFAYHE